MAEILMYQTPPKSHGFFHLISRLIFIPKNHDLKNNSDLLLDMTNQQSDKTAEKHKTNIILKMFAYVFFLAFLHFSIKFIFSLKN
jgi:hypothetical protein